MHLPSRLVIAATLVVVKNIEGDTSGELLNVSYDPTRELFQDIYRQFVARFAGQTGKTLWWALRNLET
jgi:sulfate transport system substrate-binding protein